MQPGNAQSSYTNGYCRLSDGVSAGHQALIIAATVVCLGFHRLCISWNQTGQKHAGEPDIARHWFPEHHVVMWALVMATYLRLGERLVGALKGFFVTEVAVVATALTIVPAFVFKLNFTQADAPELVREFAPLIRAWSEPFDLVSQARIVFTALGILAVTVIAQGLGLRRIRRGKYRFGKTWSGQLTSRRISYWSRLQSSSSLDRLLSHTNAREQCTAVPRL